MATISLLELENFDPNSPVKTGERRFLCPLCGDGKPRDAAHRSLSLNLQNGLWNCKRCGEKGRVREHWQPLQAPRKRAQMALKRAFEIPVAPATNPALNQENTDWRAIWEASWPLNESVAPALSYLQKRAISASVAQEGDVRFVTQWHGRPALVFPFKDAAGEVVAVAGRCLQNGGMDKPASGPKKSGAFWARAGGFGPLDDAVPAVIVCEAPFDALSFSMAGFPALAFGGTSAPAWLHQKLAFRRVLLAFDADVAGDAASAKVGAMLASYGSRCERLRPQGAKDWNELLQSHGASSIEEIVAPVMCS